MINSGVNVRLVRVGRVLWEVLAVLDDRGRSVMDDLQSIRPGDFPHIEDMRWPAQKRAEVPRAWERHSRVQVRPQARKGPKGALVL